MMGQSNKPRGKERVEAPVGAKREAPGAACAIPPWPSHLSLCREQRILRFKTREDLERAIDLLWTDELRTLPHDTPDGKSLVIPAEAVRYFSEAGLQFTDRRLGSIGELSPAEIRKLRRSQGSS
jgi:hypothetical protein